MLQGRLCRCHVSNASHRWTSTTCYKNSKFELIRYYIILWRRTAFYMVNYVLPALLINIISLFVFMMPSESGEKITLAISAMLNMTVFLMAVMEQLPPTDTISILSCVHTTDNWTDHCSLSRRVLQLDPGRDLQRHLHRGAGARAPLQVPGRGAHLAQTGQVGSLDGGCNPDQARHQC